MPILTRSKAKLLRSVLRYTLLNEEPLRAWPVVLFGTGSFGTILQAQKGKVTVRYDHPGKQPESSIAFESTLLAEFEARNDDPVSLDESEAGKGRATWYDGDVPRSVDFDSQLDKRIPQFPELPQRWLAAPNNVREALQRAASCAAQTNGRFAYSLIQLRGKKGQIISTDGRQLLIQGGFHFPWTEDLLIPALQIFGRWNLLRDGEISIGKTATHVALQIAPWTLLFDVEHKGRFPEVERVIPTKRSVCTLHVDPADVEFLRKTIPRLPPSDDEFSPVTLELGKTATLYARAKAKSWTAVELSRSVVEGKRTRFRTNRQYLLNALQFGFRDIEFVEPTKPIVCRKKQDLFVWVPIMGAEPIPKSTDVTHICPNGQRKSDPQPTKHRRPAAMPGVSKNGHKSPTANDETETSANSLEELISEAEELRRQFQNIGGRLSRLISALKQHRKQSRVVRQAVASIQQLNLGG